MPDKTKLMPEETEPVPDGCQYREHQHEARCMKLRDAGKRFCPYHELLSDMQAEERERRQNAPRAANNGRSAKRRLREERIR